MVENFNRINRKIIKNYFTVEIIGNDRLKPSFTASFAVGNSIPIFIALLCPMPIMKCKQALKLEEMCSGRTLFRE
jgi:hypothetical protein